MLTLWGPGGAGKSRLAVELGAAALGAFFDGVWFVELAPLDRAELVGPAVMAALGMLSGGEPPEEVCRYLTPRQVLLVLDNCEHLLVPAADLARAVLSRCPGVRIVASSREPLGVPGERVWPVPPLSLPDPDAGLDALAGSDAVALFCDRALAAHAGFALTAANGAAVAEICRGLDGSALALELAAARVRVLGVKGLADRLGDRLRVLTGSGHGLDARHQTLRAAVDWSYEILPQPERVLLTRLSVFPGTFDLAAAESVGAADGEDRGSFDVLDLLARLVDKSLVVPVEQDDDVRYRLLETVRQYAAEKLDAVGETRSTQRRHRDHYLNLPFVDWVTRWQGCFDEVLEVHREQDNFRAALERALADGDADAAVRLADAQWVHWMWIDHPSARAWLERVINLPDRPESPCTAELLAGYAANWTVPASLAEEALSTAARLGDPRLLAVVSRPEGARLRATSGRAVRTGRFQDQVSVQPLCWAPRTAVVILDLAVPGVAGRG